MSTSVLSRATGSLDLAGSFAVTAARFGTGVAARRRTMRPEWLFVLYEFEACPFCRIVRAFFNFTFGNGFFYSNHNGVSNTCISSF